ncbi:MAG: N-acetylmuramoyl-L-alanine amidase [Candidatus Dojkabacteria bacterium]
MAINRTIKQAFCFSLITVTALASFLSASGASSVHTQSRPDYQSRKHTVQLDAVQQVISLTNPFAATEIRLEVERSRTGVIVLEYLVHENSATPGIWSSFRIPEKVPHVSTTPKYQSEFYDADLLPDKAVSANIVGQIPVKNIDLRLKETRVLPVTVSVHFMYDGISHAPGLQQEQSYTIDGVPIRSREGWGCPDMNVNSPSNCSNPAWETEYFDLSHIIIHHTDTSNSSNDWDSEVRSIWNYHARILAWTDIGYNYLIDPNGVIYEGRNGGEGVVAGHTYAHNRGTVGISLLGNFTSSDISSSARESLQSLVGMLLARYNLDPEEVVTDIKGEMDPNYQHIKNPRISGHRDWMETECPGQILYDALPELTSRTKAASEELLAQRTALDTCNAMKASLHGRCQNYKLVENFLHGSYELTTVSFDSNGTLIAAHKDGTVKAVNQVNLRQPHIRRPSFRMNVQTGMIIDKLVPGNNVTMYAYSSVSQKIVSIGAGNAVTDVVSLTEAVTDMEYVSDTLYITIPELNAVAKVTESGYEIFAQTGARPVALTSDAGGNLYTANYHGNSVTKISPSGESHDISIPGLFPSDVAVSHEDEVYVSLYATNDVYKISTDDVVQRLAVVADEPVELHVDSQNNVYTLHDNASTVSRVSAEGKTKYVTQAQSVLENLVISNSDRVYFLNGKDSLGLFTQQNPRYPWVPVEVRLSP